MPADTAEVGVVQDNEEPLWMRHARAAGWTPPDERARIALFIYAEAQRFETEANTLLKIRAKSTEPLEPLEEAKWLRLSSKASMAKTLAAYVERGDHEMPAARGDV